MRKNSVPSGCVCYSPRRAIKIEVCEPFHGSQPSVCCGLYCLSVVCGYSGLKHQWGINFISTIKLTLNCTQQVDFAVQKAPFNCHLSKQILNWFAFFALVMSAMFLWHVFRVLFFFWNFWFNCFSSELSKTFLQLGKNLLFRYMLTLSN